MKPGKESPDECVGQEAGRWGSREAAWLGEGQWWAKQASAGAAFNPPSLSFHPRFKNYLCVPTAQFPVSCAISQGESFVITTVID